jgi:selenide,water dikinase
VGYQTSDDAGIYRLSDELALVTTADFITPPVNDPYVYGQIAAANALSDVYAMGGQPLTCLNLVCFPAQKLPQEDLHQIIAGAMNKITEAGAVLAGGHSVENDEPKFGLAVTGVVHPEKYWTNTGAQVGDVLVLTKPIGSGVLFNANLKNWVSASAMDACIQVLLTLNKTAAEFMQRLQIHSVTDVTGFGLAGHALEMAQGSGVSLDLDVERLPVMAEALGMYRKGMNTGVNAYNRQLVRGHSRILKDLPLWHEEILFDPQTSGGLLVSLPEDQAGILCRRLVQNGAPPAAIIGRVRPYDGETHLAFH